MTEQNHAETIAKAMVDGNKMTNELLQETKSLKSGLEEFAKTNSELSSKLVEIALEAKSENAQKTKSELEEKSVTIKNLEETIRNYSVNQGSNGYNPNVFEEFKSSFMTGLRNGDGNSVNLTELPEVKSGAVIFDSARGGLLFKPRMTDILVDENPFPVGISSFIRTIPSTNGVQMTFTDYSNLDIFMTQENMVAKDSNPITFNEIKVLPEKYIGKVPVSQSILEQIRKGNFSQNLISIYLNAGVRMYGFKKDKDVITKLIASSQEADTKILKTVTASTTPVMSDIYDALSKLSTLNRVNTVFAIDQGFADYLFKQVGNDGHPVFGWYEFNNSRVAGLKTNNGVIPVVPVETSFFKGYKLFDDNGAATGNNATAGFNSKNTGNGGKVLGMFLDRDESMVALEDPSFFSAELLNDAKDKYLQTAFFGFAGSYNFATKVQKSISLLINKN
jgi:HK97 family phage major capsid protein